MSLTVVIGPPASGKSTWVEQRATPADIVIDFDKLAAALTGPSADPHDHTPGVKRVAFQARRAAVAAALERADRNDVYVIHSHPPPGVLAQYQANNAEFVTIDPGKATVLERCRAERPERAVKSAEHWYATHSEGGFKPVNYSRSW